MVILQNSFKGNPKYVHPRWPFAHDGIVEHRWLTTQVLQLSQLTVLTLARYLDIRKNRFSGDLGHIPLSFSTDLKQFTEADERHRRGGKHKPAAAEDHTTKKMQAPAASDAQAELPSSAVHKSEISARQPTITSIADKGVIETMGLDCQARLASRFCLV